MNKETLRLCPTCLGRSGELLHRQDFYAIDAHPLASGYDVVACRCCGFVYADTEVSQEEYDAFYEGMSKYADLHTGTGGGLQPWDAARLRETAGSIARFIGSRNSRILDVGCANGGLLSIFRELGFQNSVGIDPSPACVRTTRAKGIEAVEGFLGSLELPTESFDCVILSHVMEHVQDLRLAMQNVLPLLRTDGTLYLEVPDATRYIDYLYAPFQDFNTEHINHFSQATLRALASQCHLTPIRESTKTIRSSETSLYPALYGFFRRADTQATFTHDAYLVNRIKLYVAASECMMSEIAARLRTSLDGASGVVVWGAGQLAMKLFQSSPLGNANVVACIDNNPMHHGRTLHGAPIVGPESIEALSHPIVITSLLHQHEIARQIRSMGLRNRLVVLRDHPESPFTVN